MSEVEDDLLRLAECPVFDKLGRVAVAFACELTAEEHQIEPSTGFRLAEIYRELFGPAGQRQTEAPAGADLARARSLFEASRSFLDDITTGPPGVNGRPLMMSAALDRDGWAGKPALIVRAPTWRYEFESAEVELAVREDAQAIPVDFNDHFCVFESGRIFYLAIFGQDEGATPRLDEYGLIQLEGLAIDPAEACSASSLGFAYRAHDGTEASKEPASLRDFLIARLKELAYAQDGLPNAIIDVLRPFGIAENNGGPFLIERDWLKNALVQVEDQPLLETARYAFEHYRLDKRDSEKDPEPLKFLTRIKARDRAWQTACDKLRGGATLHRAESFEPDAPTDADPPIARPLLAFAGLAQGIPDFPRQDDSEVHDSTRPASSATEGMFYVHPAFELAIGINWRTFSDAQRNVGGCPYAIMAWIIGLHDEVIVADMERRIERMIYGTAPRKTDARTLGRAEPAGDLMTILHRVASIVRPGRALIDDNLRARLDIFRWCSIQRSGNVFRYPTERELLDAIRQARGTDARFDDAHAMVDRYESLVEDLSSLASNYSGARAGWLLAAIAILGAIGLPDSIVQAGKVFGFTIPPLPATLLVVATVGLLFGLWNQPPSSRRKFRAFSSTDRENPRK